MPTPAPRTSVPLVWVDVPTIDNCYDSTSSYFMWLPAVLRGERYDAVQRKVFDVSFATDLQTIRQVSDVHPITDLDDPRCRSSYAAADQLDDLWRLYRTNDHDDNFEGRQQQQQQCINDQEEIYDEFCLDFVDSAEAPTAMDNEHHHLDLFLSDITNNINNNSDDYNINDCDNNSTFAATKRRKTVQSKRTLQPHHKQVRRQRPEEENDAPSHHGDDSFPL